MRMRRFLVIAAAVLTAAAAGAGEFRPPVPPPPPSSPLDFGDFSANDDIFAGFGVKEPELLDVSLAPETSSVAAATPFRLILTLNHRNGAYTYWLNPGGPGAGTKVNWSLPEGFSVSGPEWPTPEKYGNGGMTFYVHKGKTSLVYTVTPPAGLRPGEEITIRGEVETQACTPGSCTPMRIPVEAGATVAESPGSASPAAERAAASLPGPPEGWSFEAAAADGGLVILMRPQPGANRDVKDVYFFDSRGEPVVDSQLEQRLEQADGLWRLRLPVRRPGAARPEGNLTGVIRAGNGWLEGKGGPAGYRIDLPVAAGGAAARPGLRSAWALLAFAFLGGLLLNIMPCVFPVIGLKIMGFAKQAHKERRAVFLHGLAYTGGVLICFWTLASLVITMGRGWGAQLQSEWFLFALCHVFVIMSMNMAGAFDVGASVAGAGQQGVGARVGLKRSFFTGLLATLTSTPCSAPFLGTALAYALSLPPMTSLGVFTLMALGFAFPYLALSLFPGWLKRLPKPGPWMDTFRQAMCFPLFGTTAYLFWTMEAMVGEWRFLLLLFGLVLTAMACWLYGKYQRRRVGRPAPRRWLFGLAVLSLACGVWLGLPKGEDGLEWRDWSPETVSRLRREGVPVYVDFTARWCATCQLNKRVYADSGLRELIRDKKVALLKADWTLHDERITSTLRGEFDKAAVPVTVLYAPGGAAGDVLPDILTVENVAEALRGLP